MGSTSGDSTEIRFHEMQRLRSVRWAVILLGGISAAGWYVFISQIVFRHPVGTNPVSDLGAWVLWLLLGHGAALALLTLHMETVVRPGEIAVRWFPFTTRRIALGDVRRIEARQYRPILEFGGWGVRGWSSRPKIAYNLSSDWGVELTLADQRVVMIGSQRAQELAEALRTERLG